MTTREHVNLTMWVKTVQRAIAAEPHGPRRDLLIAMLVKINNKLPE
jgi:hypothetical protein